MNEVYCPHMNPCHRFVLFAHGGIDRQPSHRPLFSFPKSLFEGGYTAQHSTDRVSCLAARLNTRVRASDLDQHRERNGSISH